MAGKKKKKAKRARRNFLFCLAGVIAFELLLSTAKVQALDWLTASNSLVIGAAVGGFVAVVFLFVKLLAFITASNARTTEIALRELGQTARTRQEAPGSPESSTGVLLHGWRVERLRAAGWRVVEVNRAGGYAVKNNNATALTPEEIEQWKELDAWETPAHHHRLPPALEDH